MMQAKYKTTAGGDVVQIASGETLHVKTFSLGKNRGKDTVVLYLTDGGMKTVVRALIDEEAFQFGVLGQVHDIEKVPPAPKKRMPRRVEHWKFATVVEGHPLPPKPERGNGCVSITHEELLSIHNALQTVADMTLKRLVESIVPCKESA
jgi:hypothetical protein